MINEARVRETFLDLVRFNSPPGQEGEVARYCAEALRDAGFLCQKDAAGNLIAQKAGTVSGAPRIFFSAHMDTVQPTEGLEVREEDGIFRTGGTTILGADDKAGLTQILEGVRVLEEHGIPHGDLQVVFTTGEEVGLLGARALAIEVVAGSIGFVFDASGPTGTVITGAPTHDKLEVRLQGRASHAGFVPEKGISAIRMAARALDRMRLGRIDPETTANIGTISGGTADNIVAEEAILTLEARSRNREKLDAQVAHMRECLEEAAAHYGGSVEIRHEREYQGYTWERGDLPLSLAAAAWRNVPASRGEEPTFRPTGGGSDANVFNARGVPAVVCTCGYADAHSVKEHIPVADLLAGAEWVVRIAEAAAV
ncbi:MAG: M20/M25/M40 family metallo-hydrolase [Armatimonadota bacterium]